MKLEPHELQTIASQLENYVTIKVVAETEDRLINKTELANKLGCGPKEVTRLFVSRPGFPRVNPQGDSGRVMFSIKAVDKWIAENQTINY